MLSFLTYTLLTTADMFWIGKLGPAKVAAVAVTGMIMYRITALFGTFALAAFGIGTRVIHIIFIYMEGLMVATEVLVGQYLGAGERERTKEVSHKTLRIGLVI